MNTSMWRTLLPHVLGADEYPDPQTLAAYKLARADQDAQRLAAACVNELSRLIQKGGVEHFLHAAVMGAATLESSPRDWLRTQLGMLQAEIVKVAQERETAECRQRAELAARKPLMDVVRHLSLSAQTERETLTRHLAALRSEQPKRGSAQKLREAGVPEEQIAKLQLDPAEDPEQQIRTYRERILVLDSHIARCTAYHEDPTHSPEHVRGIVPDELVHAQLAGATAAA